MSQARRTGRKLLCSTLAILLLAASLLLPREAYADEVPTSGAEPAAPGALGTAPLFGVQMYGNTGKTVKYFPFLTESKASWLRVQIHWRSVEPLNTTPNLYNWASVDGSVAAALDTQINLILTIESAPGWAATHKNGPIDKVDISEFTEFMQALVERYDGDGIDDAPGSPVVNYFELYNEPDGHCSGVFRWGAAGDKYAAMLKAIAPAIKQANPNAKTVFGGIAFDWFNSKSCDPNALTDNWPVKGGPFVFEFLDDVLKAGGGQYFDVMNFHFYSAFAPNWTRFPGSNGLSVGLLEKTNYVRQKLQDYGVGDKPIIITEAGHNSNPTPGNDTSQQMQAQFVPVLFSQGMAGRLQILIWWLLYDLTLDDYPFQNGLVTRGDPIPEKKLAFDAYKTAVTQLGSASFVRTLSAAETGLPLNGFPTMEAYKFHELTSNNTLKRIIYTAWLDPMWEEANKTPKPLKLPAKQVTIRDIYGTVKATIQDADDGKMDNRTTVGITGEPVYIEVDPADNINLLFLSRISR
ncbi:MAG: cellulase family glycosylhydrolase [Caldilineaceae bacterium]|nr:cellulase family glycosylhydrolase [Caldilineaceae bacterium]HRJ40365.1 cellulase family glycosylhydrolase [Caldilineaceae bacterium]